MYTGRLANMFSSLTGLGLGYARGGSDVAFGRQKTILLEFEKLIQQGPISHDIVLTELDRRGLRGVTDGELFILNSEHPVAEFDEASRTWNPVGAFPTG